MMMRARPGQTAGFLSRSNGTKRSSFPSGRNSRPISSSAAAGLHDVLQSVMADGRVHRGGGNRVGVGDELDARAADGGGQKISQIEGEFAPAIQAGQVPAEARSVFQDGVGRAQMRASFSARNRATQGIASSGMARFSRDSVFRPRRGNGALPVQGPCGSLKAGGAPDNDYLGVLVR